MMWELCNEGFRFEGMKLARTFVRNKIFKWQGHPLSDIYTVKPGQIGLLQYFIYLIVESQKLTCRVRSETIVLSNISVMMSVEKVLNDLPNGFFPNDSLAKRNRVPTVKSKIIDCSAKENDGSAGASNRKRKRASSRDGADAGKKRKPNAIKHAATSSSKNKASYDSNNNNNNKRRGQHIDENTSKRIRLQRGPPAPPESVSSGRDELEIADEINLEWEQFRCEKFCDVLHIIKREWDVRHLSDLHKNSTHSFYRLYRGRPCYSGDCTTVPCTFIFDPTIKCLHQSLLDVKGRAMCLERQVKRYPPGSRSFYQINKEIGYCKQEKRKLKDALAKLYAATTEIEWLNKVYEAECREYRKDVLWTNRFDLQIYQEFYENDRY